MSVTITITDPSSTPSEELQAVIAMLRGFTSAAAPTVAEVPAEEPGPFAKAFREIFDEIGIPSAGDVREAAAKGAAEALAEVPPALVEMPPITDATTAFGIAATVAFGAPSAPIAPPPPPAVPAVDLDKEGIPWDGRIHASTKTKTVEGVWKKKRNVEPEIVDAVTAELRMTMAAPAAAPAESIEPTPSVVVPPAPLVAAIVPPPPPPAPPAATGISFAEFMGHVTAGVTSTRFTREDVAAACVKNGVPNLPGLINRPDLIPAVARELGLMA